ARGCAQGGCRFAGAAAQIRTGGREAAVSFAEPISLSSTVRADLRLPPTALGLGFVLLALRARRARESRRPRLPAQEVPETKMSQFGRSAFTSLACADFLVVS